jgi:outer membrane receptor protein involved in Fe transport
MTRNVKNLRTHRTPSAHAVLIFVIGTHGLPGHAQQAAQTPPVQMLQNVEIVGERTRVPITRVTQDIEAAPASTTVLDRRDLDRLSISTYGDMFRNVTGVSVIDYGQGLVAYEIKMRGFASGHGRDIAFTLDGVPLNISGSSHTNGYADLAQVIAETVNRVEIVRGPFSATAGNHAVAGSVNFYTDRDTRSQVKVDVDSFGRTRVLPVYSGDAGPGRLLMALDTTQGKGHTEQSDLQRTNVFVRYGLGLGAGQASVRLQHYDADADAPGYLNLARIQSGAVSPRAALSPGIGDAKTQTNVVLNYRSDDADGKTGVGSGWSASLYAVRDDRRRWANYDPNTPVGAAPDLESERDRLNQRGLDIRKATALGDTAQVLVGAQVNDEQIDAMVFFADSNRRPLGDAAVVTQRDLSTRSTALFADFQLSPVPSLKLQAGLRWDQIAFGIDLQPLDDAFGGPSGDRIRNTKRQVSPKLGLAWAIVEGSMPVELFANAARGLKSPYAYREFDRLAQTNITPLTSVELGLQGGDAASHWRAAVWQTRQDKEALFDGANQFIGNQRTNRDGFDIEARLALADELRLMANYSGVRARVLGQGSSDRIPSVPEWTAGIGLEGTVPTGAGRVEWSLNDTLVGPQPLLADNSARTQSYQRITGRAALTPAACSGAKVALALTHYTRPYEEQQFDAGNGQFGTAPKPRWQAMISAQYAF